MSCADIERAEEIFAGRRRKLAEADKLTLQFVEDFRRTLNFKTVWDRYRVSDDSCTVRYWANGFLELEANDKTIPESLARRFYLSFWNLGLLNSAYGYSLAPYKGRSEPDFEKLFSGPSMTKGTREILKVEKKTKFASVIDDEDKAKPKTAVELSQLATEADRLAAVLRRNMPKNAMRTPNWRFSVDWLKRVAPMRMIPTPDPDAKECVWREKLYISQIGPFVLAFVDRNNKLKLLTMYFPDN